jgi:hypothetical protein
MDESVRLFREEQKRFAEAGGVTPWLKRHFFDTLLGIALIGLVGVLLMAALGSLPLNPDHSLQFMYSGPILIILGTSSAIILRRYPSLSRWWRPTLWALIAMPLILVPAAMLDMVWRNGS